MVEELPRRHLLGLAASLLLPPAAAHSKTRSAPHAHSELPPTPYTLVMDEDGNVLQGNHENSPWPPASTTKLMTMYLVFERLKAGKFKLDQEIKISSHAANEQKTKIWLTPDQPPTVEKALDGMIVHSANDCAVALAENVCKSEALFAKLMNKKAEELGMKNSHFLNASGLPAKKQVTTAYDMALLMKALHRDFPEYWHRFKTSALTYNGREFNHRTDGKIMEPGLNYRGLTDVDIEADKTGYIQASHSNIVVWASHEGKGIIVVVMGAPSSGARQAEVKRLIEFGFSDQPQSPNKPSIWRGLLDSLLKFPVPE